MMYFLVKDFNGVNRALPLVPTLSIHSGFSYHCDKDGDATLLNYLRREFGDIEHSIAKDEEMASIDRHPIALSVQEVFSRVSQAANQNELLVDLTKESGPVAFKQRAEQHRLNKKFDTGIA